MTENIDTNRNVTAALPRLKAAGVKRIGRYIDSGAPGGEKHIKPAEARAIAAAGMELFLIYENNGRPFGAGVGDRDGTYAARVAPTLGAPEGEVIWYTADFDPKPSEFASVIAAFVAFKAALRGRYKVGCYGSGALCDALYHAGIIVARWITMSGGFGGSQAAITGGRYEFHQLLPHITGGIDTDPDVIRVSLKNPDAAIGSFVPFHASPSIAPAPHPVQPTTIQPKPAPRPQPVNPSPAPSTAPSTEQPKGVLDTVGDWIEKVVSWKPDKMW